MPDQKKARFIADFGLSSYDAGVLVAERESANFYEAVLAKLADKARDGKLAANWVINELFGRLNKEGRDITGSPVSAEQLGSIVDLIGEGTISGKIAKDLFEIVWTEGGDPRALVDARGMKQVTDLGAIEKVVDEHHRRQSRQGGAGQGEAGDDRLVRRPGDEVVRRQGQSAVGERSAQIQTRHLNAARSVRRHRRCGVVGCVWRRASLVHRDRARAALKKNTLANRPSRFAQKTGFGERR